MTEHKHDPAVERVEEIPHCTDTHVHETVVEEIRPIFPPEEHLYALADLYKIFGDSTRIKIMFSLYEEEMCVCAISELLGMTQSAISHQLKVLKDAKLVANRREGKTIYYRLSDDHVKSIIAQGFDHLLEEDQ